jgi:hypothetical protein
MPVSWVVVRCVLVEVYRCFRNACCGRPDDGDSKNGKRRQTSARPHGASTQKKAVFIPAPAGTESLSEMRHVCFERETRILNNYCLNSMFRKVNRVLDVKFAVVKSS